MRQDKTPRRVIPDPWREAATLPWDEGLAGKTQQAPAMGKKMPPWRSNVLRFARHRPAQHQCAPNCGLAIEQRFCLDFRMTLENIA
jgi:hypothetical protein